MKVKLVDVEENPSEELTGTCDLCYSTMYCDNPVYVFQSTNSKDEVRVNGYWWEYDYYDEAAVPNVINFADWLIEVANTYNSIYTPYRDVNGKLIKVGNNVKVSIKFSKGKTIEFVSKVRGNDCDYYVSNGGDDYSLYDLCDPQEYWEGAEQRIDNATVEIV